MTLDFDAAKPDRWWGHSKTDFIEGLCDKYIALTEEAISQAQLHKNDRLNDCPINWADLGCISCRFFVEVPYHECTDGTWESEIGFEVLISEASPDGNYDFHEFIRNWFKTRVETTKLEPPQVRTEW